jgi:hypothetical protein
VSLNYCNLETQALESGWPSITNPCGSRASGKAFRRLHSQSGPERSLIMF